MTMAAPGEFSGLAASVAAVNVDTDTIIPIEYCVNRQRPHFDEGLFHNWRFDTNGDASNFVLNRAPWNECKVLVTGENFGCGSSREMAVWALADFGIRCVIGPSFGEIFYNNCFLNGVLAAVVDARECARLHAMVDDERGVVLEIDLAEKQVRTPDRSSINFRLDDMRRQMLREGLDPISTTLTRLDSIEAFEKNDRQQRPWAQRVSTPHR